MIKVSQEANNYIMLSMDWILSEWSRDNFTARQTLFLS